MSQHQQSEEGWAPRRSLSENGHHLGEAMLQSANSDVPFTQQSEGGDPHPTTARLHDASVDISYLTVVL